MGCAEGQSPFAGSLRVSLRYNFFLLPGTRKESEEDLEGYFSSLLVISMKTAPAAMCNTRCCSCSDNRCIAVSLATRTPTTLNGLPKTRLCVSSSGGKVLISRQPAPTL